MELATITMDKTEARAAFLDYRRAVRARHNSEDEQIMRGYRALANGNTLIHLTDTIRAGDVDHLGRPRLAVARADARRVFMERSRTGRLEFGSDERPWNLRGLARGRLVRFGAGTLPEVPSAGWSWDTGKAQAIVPSIPPALRPDGKLDRFHILFEAEWHNVPPIDPALIRHLGGDLWVVLAIWDLTPVERAVLGARGSA